MSQFKQYRRRQIAELRPYISGESMAAVSVSVVDAKAGSPKVGDMIARNPVNHEDQWLVAKEYFEVNFERMEATEIEWSTSLLHRVYDILVTHAGAPEGERRDAFVHLFMSPTHTPHEWRFQGTLGFGGKLWVDGFNLGYRVSCYAEDETSERLAIITKVNMLLKDVPFYRPPNG